MIKKQDKNMVQIKYYYGEEVQMLNHQNFLKMMKDIQGMIQNIQNFQKKICQKQKI